MAMIGNVFMRTRPTPQLDTPTDHSEKAIEAVSQALNALLADTYALYIKTKSYHWHASGPHFRSHHLLFDEQAKEMLETTDALAERVRKIGGTTIRSIGHIARLQRIDDDEREFVAPEEMLRTLMSDNKDLMVAMRAAHGIAEEHRDIATAGLLETFIDNVEKRNWFLFEASRTAETTTY